MLRVPLNKSVRSTMANLGLRLDKLEKKQNQLTSESDMIWARQVRAAVSFSPTMGLCDPVLSNNSNEVSSRLLAWDPCRRYLLFC